MVAVGFQLIAVFDDHLPDGRFFRCVVLRDHGTRRVHPIRQQSQLPNPLQHLRPLRHATAQRRGFEKYPFDGLLAVSPLSEDLRVRPARVIRVVFFGRPGGRPALFAHGDHLRR